MRVCKFVAAVYLAVLVPTTFLIAQESDTAPRLLLNAQRFRRLQRDRERQTPRWLNFERRVQTSPVSTQRGFELALYYAVTRDEGRGREAIAWAMSHRCEYRQVALVLDWVGELISPAQRAELAKRTCVHATAGASTKLAPLLRDSLFMAVEAGSVEQMAESNKQLVDYLTKQQVLDPEDLYASAEYLMTVRSVQHIDLRRENVSFFSGLPKEFLLSRKPHQVEHPGWMSHIAALALVALDPNLEGSQFLQGWAMEGRQTLRDGPGAAYEFLWADPYLPGIAYQNMDPWTYQPSGRLFARADWNENSCWVSVSPGSAQFDHCPEGSEPLKFGTMTLLKRTADCLNIPQRAPNETFIVWNLKPGGELSLKGAPKQVKAAADPAGMWLVTAETAGKVCVLQHDRN